MCEGMKESSLGGRTTTRGAADFRQDATVTRAGASTTATVEFVAATPLRNRRTARSRKCGRLRRAL